MLKTLTTSYHLQTFDRSKMAGDDGRYSSDVRARMDRSLDEIAAEMHSTQVHQFGTDYKNRPFDGAENYRMLDRSSKRYTPYSIGSSRSNRRDSSVEREKERSHALGNRRVFVANLSYDTTWQRLKDHMRKCGPVLRCDIFTEPNGSSRGMGLVEFENEEGAERALRQLADSFLDNRKIMVRKDMHHQERERVGISSYQTRGRPPPTPATTVFVGNLDYSITWQKLKDVFKVAGKIVNVEVAKDRDNKSKGYGEVQFEEPSEAYNAIALFHGQMLCDRPMIVRMDSKAPYQPDPLQLKLSGKGLPGSSTIGINLPLLNALISSLSSDKFASLVSQSDSPTTSSRMMDFTDHSTLPALAPLPPLSHDLPHNVGALYMEGAGGYNHGNKYVQEERMRDTPFYGGGREMDRWRGDVDHRRAGYHSIGSGSHSRSSGVASSHHHYDRGYRRERERDGGPHLSAGEYGFPSRNVFVKNLNYITTWQYLKDQFKRAGAVRHVDILKNSDGRSKGCAVVSFLDEQGAHRAIEMFNNSELDGRKLEVRFDKLS